MSKKRKYAEYTEETLESALQLIRSGNSIRGAGKRYSIPESTLRIKINRNVPKSSIRYTNSVLTQQEEEQLFKWIKECAQNGPVGKYAMRHIKYRLLFLVRRRSQNKDLRVNGSLDS